jgi:hypothetical protein
LNDDESDDDVPSSDGESFRGIQIPSDAVMSSGRGKASKWLPIPGRPTVAATATADYSDAPQTALREALLPLKAASASMPALGRFGASIGASLAAPFKAAGKLLRRAKSKPDVRSAAPSIDPPPVPAINVNELQRRREGALAGLGQGLSGFAHYVSKDPAQALCVEDLKKPFQRLDFNLGELPGRHHLQMLEEVFQLIDTARVAVEAGANLSPSTTNLETKAMPALDRLKEFVDARLRPHFQRGAAWTDEEVKALMNDISEANDLVSELTISYQRSDPVAFDDHWQQGTAAFREELAKRLRPRPLVTGDSPAERLQGLKARVAASFSGIEKVSDDNVKNLLKHLTENNVEKLLQETKGSGLLRSLMTALKIGAQLRASPLQDKSSDDLAAAIDNLARFYRREDVAKRLRPLGDATAFSKGSWCADDVEGLSAEQAETKRAALAGEVIGLIREGRELALALNTAVANEQEPQLQPAG